jgi:hypothetical protein
MLITTLVRKHNHLRFVFKTLTAFTFAAFGLLASAAVFMHTAEGASFDNPLASSLIMQLLRGFVAGVIYVGTPAVAVFMAWSGFLFISARADPQRLTKAKHMFVQSVFAAVLLLGIWTIATLVGNTLAGLSAASILIILAFFYLWVMFRK